MLQILVNNRYCDRTISLQYPDASFRYWDIFDSQVDYFHYRFLNIFCVSDYLADLVINQLISDSKIWIWRWILERAKSDKVASRNICSNFYNEGHCPLAWIFQSMASFWKELSQKFYECAQLDCFCSLVCFLEFDPNRISVTNSLLQL